MLCDAQNNLASAIIPLPFWALRSRRILDILHLSHSSSPELFVDVARLHIAEIHHGLLPLLGLKFMARMYYELARAPRTGVWVAVESNQLAGFVSGCADVSATYRSLLLKGMVPLGLRAMGALFKPTLLLKLPSLFLYPFRRAKPSGSDAPVGEKKSHAELLSIAVSSAFQRRGVGRQLVDVFEKAMREWDVKDCYYVTTNRDEEASNHFYRSLHFQPVGTIPHHELVLQQYCRHLHDHETSAI